MRKKPLAAHLGEGEKKKPSPLPFPDSSLPSPPFFLFAYFSFVIGSSATTPSVPSSIYAVSFSKVDGALGSNCSKLYLRSSINLPRHVPLHCTHQSRPLPMVPITSDFGNPATDCDLHTLARGSFAFWPESSSSLPPVVFCELLCFFFFNFSYFFSFSVYFVVLTCWVKDVNNFLAWESRRISFGRKMCYLCRAGRGSR